MTACGKGHSYLCEDRNSDGLFPATRGVEVIDRIRNNQDVSNNLTLLGDLCDTMRDGSLCAMGGLTPVPVRSIMKHFGHELVSAGKESSL